MVTRTQEHRIFNTTYKQFETNQLKYVQSEFKYILKEVLRLQQLRQSLVNLLSFNVTMEPAFWDLKNVMVFVIATLLAKMKKIVRVCNYINDYYISMYNSTRSLILCVVCFRSLLVILSFFFWPLSCLSFFDLQIHSDYPFDIFKLFLHSYICCRQHRLG